MTTTPRVLNLRGRRGIVPPGAIGDRMYRGPWRLPASKWANPTGPGATAPARKSFGNMSNTPSVLLDLS
jgi:hypothetical protein